MKTTPKISDNGQGITNFKEVVEELQANPECHGDGTLYARYTDTDD